LSSFVDDDKSINSVKTFVYISDIYNQQSSGTRIYTTVFS